MEVRSLSALSISVALLATASAGAQDPTCLVPVAELTASSPASSSFFGGAVAVSGDTLVVGAREEHTATVFERSAGVWQGGQELSNGEAGSEFGESVAIDGDTIVVGSWKESPGGAAYVYTRTGSRWNQQDVLLPEAGAVWFGSGVAVDGDRIAVADTGTRDLYVFRRNGTVWSQEGLVSPNAGGWLGTSLALDGDTLVAGGPRAFPSPGAVVEIAWDGTSWNERPLLPSPNNSTHDRFGQSVALDGTRLLVGAPQISSAYVFERQGTSWVLDESLSGPSQPPSFFGTSVALEGDAVMIGARAEREAGVEVGAARFFLHDGGWVLRQLVRGRPGSELGISVAMDGGTYVAGARSDTVTVPFEGSALVWEEPPAPVTYCTAGATAAGCQGQIDATGYPRAQSSAGFHVTVDGVEGAVNGLLFLGTLGRQANPWGNGTSLRCVLPPVQRTALQTSTGSPGQCNGSFALDFNVWMTAHPAQAPAVGTRVQLQGWFRDPQNTSNQSTSLSDALEFTVCL